MFIENFSRRCGCPQYNVGESSRNTFILEINNIYVNIMLVTW